MSVTKSKKYFGEKPLDGPTPFGAMYREKKNIRSENFRRNSGYNLAYPSPEQMEEYERICEGSSSHIIALLDKEQIHRQKMSIRMQKSRIFSDRLKTLLQASCMLANTSAVVYLSMIGQYIPSSITAVALLLSVKLFYSNKQSYHNSRVANNRFRRKNK